VIWDLALWVALISITVVAAYASWERLTNQILPGILEFVGVSSG
jgi:hypothetical protein